MWQCSSTGKIAGITDDVDLDECYMDYPSIIKNAGLNGFSASKKHRLRVYLDDALIRKRCKS